MYYIWGKDGRGGASSDELSILCYGNAIKDITDMTNDLVSLCSIFFLMRESPDQLLQPTKDDAVSVLMRSLIDFDCYR